MNNVEMDGLIEMSLSHGQSHVQDTVPEVGSLGEIPPVGSSFQAPNARMQPPCAAGRSWVAWPELV